MKKAKAEETPAAESKKPKVSVDAVRVEHGTVGETLRAARLAKGLEIEEVSSSVHIRTSQLRAIEENNISALPGMTYAIGFVRSYANFLGLNGAEIVHKFKVEHGHSPSPSKLVFPEPVIESRVPDPVTVGVGALLALVLIVGWTVYSNNGSSSEKAEVPAAPAVVAESSASSSPEAAADTPAAPEQQATQEAPLSSAPVPALSMAAEPGTEAPPATALLSTPSPAAPESSSNASEGVAAPAGAAPSAVPEAAKTEASPAVTTEKAEDKEKEKTETKAETKAVAAAKEDEQDDEEEQPVINIKRGKGRISVKAKQSSWLEIMDARGKVIYRKVLRAGDQYFVPDQPGLSLATANAGGLSVLVDGEEAPSLGKPGDIVKGVVLDPASLKKRRAPAFNN